MTNTKKTQEDKIDRQMKESFPASDAPSYAGGDHIIGAPKGRESSSPGGGSAEVKNAERALRARRSK